MVMQNPQLESWDVLECGAAAPLDLSTSSSGTKSRDTCSTASPDYCYGPDDDRGQGPVDEGYRVEDYLRYHAMESMVPEHAIVSDDSNDSSEVTDVLCVDDSDGARGLTHTHAKSYKKAMMRRYFDKDRSRKGSRHSPMKSTTTAATSTRSAPSISKGTSTSSRRNSWHQINSYPNNTSPTLNIGYTSESFMTHPASHIGHRTAYSLSHPKTSDTERSHAVSYHSTMIPTNTEVTITTSVPGTSSNRETSTNSSWSSWRQTTSRSSNNSPTPTSIKNTNEAYITHPSGHGGHRSNSKGPTQNSIYTTNENYTIHPAAHVGHLPSDNSPSHNSMYNTNETYTILVPAAHAGHLPSDSSPTHKSMYNTNETYTILVPAAHVGHLTSYSTPHSKNLDYKRKYSNGCDNSWEHLSEEYDALNLYYPVTNSNTSTDGYTLNNIERPALEYDGNYTNNDYEDLRTLSPQNLTIDIHENSLENADDLLIRETGQIPNMPLKKPDIEINLSPECLEAVLRKVPGVASRARWPKSWEFVMRLLVHEETNPSLVRWEDKSQFIFRLVQSNMVTHIWNTKSEKASQSYYNFARGLRYHYKKHILIPIKEKQLVYQCGPKAVEYINEYTNALRMSNQL